LRKFFAIVFLLIFAVAGWVAWLLWTPVTPTTQTFVLLRPGYSVRRIAHELKAAGVIHNANAFVLWHYLHRKHSLKAGEYLFTRTATTIDIHERLVRGDIYVHTVVIPEGFNIFEIAKAIQDAGLGPQEDFLKVAGSTALISDFAPDAKSLEGYLFPNTYEFTRTQSMQEMAATMVRQFRQVAQSIGLTANIPETVALASIIEKETAVSEERPIVASVYTNRLEKKMPLQADPSILYAQWLDGAYTGALHHGDTRYDSPYNTYRHPGLPPGPIANPGKSALEAAMHPAETDYFYFVSDGDRRHRFSHSLDEHNRNVTAYRKRLRGR
jgi:UPF0755 protein